MAAPTLLADIGGTNARFALAQGGRLGPIVHLAVADFPGPAAAIRTFLSEHARARPKMAVLAVAGPVEGPPGAERVHLTNGTWVVSAAALRTAFGLRMVRIVNDFAAIAWAVPRLAPRHLVTIGAGRAVRRAPVAVLGPGTGLGMAAYLPDPRHPAVLVTEGGHATMPAVDEREARLIAHLRAEVGHVSIERVLSGGGIEHLYGAIGAVEGLSAPVRDVATITGHALAGDCALCVRTLETFCAMLGTVAGNVALTYGARGGVLFAGGIVPRFVDFLARSAFRSRFEAKGRMSAYVRAIPTRVVIHPDPAFLGLMELLRHLSSGR